MPSVAFFSSPVDPFCALALAGPPKLTFPSRLEDPVKPFPADIRVAREPLDARLLYPARNHRRRELREHERPLPEERCRRLGSLTRGVRRVRDVLEAGPGVSWVYRTRAGQQLAVGKTYTYCARFRFIDMHVALGPSAPSGSEKTTSRTYAVSGRLKSCCQLGCHSREAATLVQISAHLCDPLRRTLLHADYPLRADHSRLRVHRAAQCVDAVNVGRIGVRVLAHEPVQRVTRRVAVVSYKRVPRRTCTRSHSRRSWAWCRVITRKGAVAGGVWRLGRDVYV